MVLGSLHSLDALIKNLILELFSDNHREVNFVDMMVDQNDYLREYIYLYSIYVYLTIL